MNKTDIEWCDMKWNPVTGCNHNCPYCYAKRFVKRFNGDCEGSGTIHELERLEVKRTPKKFVVKPYPYGFDPTFHKYRLHEPFHIIKPQNVFVCSMADLFGDWVPDEWIEEVFRACNAAPQHRYIFLTKNPKRYMELLKNNNYVMKHWFGTTITDEDTTYFYSDRNNAFLSIEPIQTSFAASTHNRDGIKWVIIGAETGNRKGKVIPKREWIENIVKGCRERNVPIFIKNNLAEIWGKPLIQEYPWERG
jgi:protein gp37